MKRIDVNKTKQSSSSAPRPWGPWGALWRYLLFLALLTVYCLLLGLISGPGCSSHRGDLPQGTVEIVEPDHDTLDPDLIEIIDSQPGDLPFNNNIVDPVPELPAPVDNHLIDVPEEEIIVNPDNPYKQIVASKLDVILDSNADDSTFNQFATAFKRLYPSDDYYINYYNQLTKMLQLTIPVSRRKYIHDNLNSQIPDIPFKIFYEEMFEYQAKAADHNDPAFSDSKKSWYFAPIQAYDAWEITKGSPDVVVAIIDNYIDVTHPELEGRIKGAYSVERQSRNVMPPSGVSYSFDDPEATVYHGTHVAATAVGALDNKQGTAGIAPECTLMPISLGDQITSMKLLDGILYAINQGASVINLSVGNYYSPEAANASEADQLNYSRNEGKYMQDVWDYVFRLADERNVTIVWAGGNQAMITGMDECKRNDNTLRVSAVDHYLQLADFSNYGRFDNYNINYSDVSAPGVDIWNAGPANNYGYADGTSMAAPIVTGAVALMKSVNPNLTNSEIVKIINDTSKKLPTAQHAGGLLQIKDALNAVGGSVANFDEIVEDKNRILGDWETTEKRDVTLNDVPTGYQAHIFLHFATPTSGTISYREDTGNVYTAPFTATYGSDYIKIKQTRDATCPGQDDLYSACEFIGRRGPNGLMECTRSGGAVFFLIRR